MKKTSIPIFLSLLLFACKKSDNDSENDKASETPNWEIVQNFPQDKSYLIAHLYSHNDQPFLSTYGNSPLSNPSTINNQFQGTLFFHKPDGWYANQSPNEAVLSLKEFNGVLYGIREKRTVYRTQPVLEYQHTYTLFKWENYSHVDLDVLEYTNANQIEKAMLVDPALWINNNKLHFIAGTSLSALRIWEVNSNNKLVVVHNEISPVSEKRLITDNKEISFTAEQIVNEGYITRYRITGHYFTNGNLTKGDTHEFYTEYLVNGNIYKNTRDITYQALNGSLFGFGFENNKIKNHDNGQIAGTISAGNVFRGDIMIRKNGKLYMILGDEKESAACKGLVVFDGTTLKELPFNLPEILDPCSWLIDATEINGKIYLLLNNRGQYVVVKNI